MNLDEKLDIRIFEAMRTLKRRRLQLAAAHTAYGKNLTKKKSRRRFSERICFGVGAFSGYFAAS